uniref:Uncharacterized protein n=1 Tax=Arundo donax TaxID=35708 RepID=A0A0A9A5N4_ARUDO
MGERLGLPPTGIITLLPKVVEASRIQQFMTIIIEPFMGKLINKCQNAFIKGRNIMDGVMALHEILHETKVQEEVGVILKLDFEKPMTR